MLFFVDRMIKEKKFSSLIWLNLLIDFRESHGNILSGVQSTGLNFYGMWTTVDKMKNNN